MKKTYNVNIARQEPIPSPREIREELPITASAAENVYAGRAAVQNILLGADPRLMIITGPCSVDDVGSASEYARRLAALSRKTSGRLLLIMRAYFEKPRTTTGWKGLIYDPGMDGSYNMETGIRLARKLLLELAELGVPAGSEMLEPLIPQFIADLVSWAAIGARTTESQTHRQMASGLSMPVGFKNTTDGDIRSAVDAVKTAAAKHAFLGFTDDARMGIFHTKGNKFCHPVLRGGSDGPNYGSEYIAFTSELLRKSGLPRALIVDCSHGNSGKRADRQCVAFRDALRQISGGETAIKGLMIESHLKAGKQDMEKLSTLEPGVSVTDECVGWDETERLVLEAYETMGGISQKT
jgi:3-deoxy-7-phosphoheptulonate synthase